MNIRLDIQYDGTDFCGSQIQVNVRTVQEELSKAVFEVFKKKVNLIFSGRTDSGVHAKNQVVNFKIETTIPPEKIMYPIRKFLPSDIFITKSSLVNDSFHARFSPKYRIYRYFLREKPDLFRNKYTLIYPRKIDIDKLNKVAETLLGKHNFKSFCASNSEVTNYECDIEMIRFFKENDETVFEIKANRYLHNMIRILISVFINVNEDKLTKEDIFDILEKQNRIYAPKTISPKGLFLWEIGY